MRHHTTNRELAELTLLSTLTPKRRVFPIDSFYFWFMFGLSR
jgi:hypothetical protein